MTGNDIVNKVRGKLGDTSFDSGLILDAANWFVNQLFFNNATRMMEFTDTLFPSAGDTTMELPDDMQTLITLNVISPSVYELKDFFLPQITFMKRYPFWNATTTTANQPQYWTDFNNTVRFNAPLDQDYEIAIDYIRIPAIMVALTDTCEVPDTYQELVVLGSLYRCMQTNEDYPEAEQELANLAPLTTAFIAQESRGQMKTGPVVIRSNRRRGGIRSSAFGDW